MEIEFTKGSGKCDRMGVIRDGVRGEAVACPKQGIIPHDLIHYAVESGLHRRGFITRVLAGEVATMRMSTEAETDGVERLVEVFQADGWAGWNTAAEDLLDLYRVTCNARECAPLPVRPDDVESVRLRLLQLSERWRAVPVGEALTLRF